MSTEAIEAWKKVKPYVDAIHPYVEKCKPLLEKAPVLREYCQHLIELLRPYHTDEVMHISFALVLLFMGGQFAMTIACVQAFKMSGWSTMKEAWAHLQEGYTTALEALNKDQGAKELFSKDGTSNLDIWQVGSVFWEMLVADSDKERELSMKRLIVIMKCVDPNRIMEGIKGLWFGVVAVLSTLRFRMAYCVSMGANIGKLACQTLEHFLKDQLYEKFPDHKKWVDFAFKSGCGLVGILFSLAMARLVSAFYSALQGATLLTKVIFRYIHERDAKASNNERPTLKHQRSSLGKIIFAMPGTTEVSKGKLDKKQEIVMGCIAVFGLLTQIKTGFNLPWIIKIPLCPLYLLENMLSLLAIY